MNALQVPIDRPRVDRRSGVVAVFLALPAVLGIVLGAYLFVAMDAGAQVLVFAIPVVGWPRWCSPGARPGPRPAASSTR